MPSMKELFEQRKSAKETIKGRVPIVRVLLAFGFFLIFAVFSITSFGQKSQLSPVVMLGCSIGFFAFFFVLVIKYNKSKTSEQERKKVEVKNAIGSIVFMIILIGLLFFGLSFFIWLSAVFPFTTALVPQNDQGRLVGVLIACLVVYFSASPFIMALWYKTAPAVAVKFILKVFKTFNWKTKDKTCEILVLPSVQDHSFFITFKRAFTALIFSLTIVFSIWLPFLGAIKHNIPPEFARLLVIPATISSIDSLEFIQLCTSLMLNIVIPVVASFVIFFWALPSTYLLDDAGIVYFKKYLKRRQPAELRTVSEWFFSIIKTMLGTSALFAYIWFVLGNRNIVVDVYTAVLDVYNQTFATVAAIQFSVFLFGFPVIGTVLMAFILLLFQESQFNKLKTHLYQELINAKIDPRIVKIGLDRKDQLQDKTLVSHVGENFFHNPPIKDSITKFPPNGEISLKDLLKK